MKLLSLICLSSSLAISPLFATATTNSSAPTVSVLNGTYYGSYVESFNQDLFLGIPYAQPPLGSLRFLPPQSLNQSFSEPRNATEYGDVCIGLGLFGDNKGLPASEDCLSLNIVKPHGGNYSNLPVAIWIHGGGFEDGSSRRDVYNLSYIVANGVDIGQPFIGVSINYRLAAFGGLQSRQVSELGATNVGLRDQLKAIEWVHENIAQFGGNPGHIVIWGESAGSISVAHLLGSAHLGDYIAGGIMESGSTQSLSLLVAGDEGPQELFDNLTLLLNCSELDNEFECLQTVNVTDLTNALLDPDIVSDGYFVDPYIDGDIIKGSATLRLRNLQFAKIPIIIGTNTDEGTAFANTNLNSTNDIKIALQANFPFLKNATADEILALYPFGDKLFQCPYDPPLGVNTTLPSTFGPQFPRYASIYGDITFIGPRRYTAEQFAKAGAPVYSYRWNVADAGVPGYEGATHFQEVVYVFDNPNDKFVTAAPWNRDSSSDALAELISKQWVSFITTLTPNNHGLSGVPEWPEYSTNNGQNFVFELGGKSHIEQDNFRSDAIKLVTEKIYNQLQH